MNVFENVKKVYYPRALRTSYSGAYQMHHTRVDGLKYIPCFVPVKEDIESKVSVNLRNAVSLKERTFYWQKENFDVCMAFTA